MPIIQMPSPLTAASDTAAGIGQARDLALQRKMEIEKQQHDEQYQQQVLALQQRQADETQKVDEAQIQSQQLHDAIAKETAEYEKTLRPMQEQLLKAQVTGANTQNQVLKITAAANALDLKIKQKYGDQQAQAMLAQIHAQISATLASSAASYASANYENAMAGSVRAGGGRGGLTGAQRLTQQQQQEELPGFQGVVDSLFQGGAFPDPKNPQQMLGPMSEQQVEAFILMSPKVPTELKAQLIHYAKTHHNNPNAQGPGQSNVFQQLMNMQTQNMPNPGM